MSPSVYCDNAVDVTSLTFYILADQFLDLSWSKFAFKRKNYIEDNIGMRFSDYGSEIVDTNPLVYFFNHV